MNYHHFEALLNALLPFAHQQLEKHSEFFPFGGVILPNLSISFTGIDIKEERPSVERVLEEYNRIFKIEADQAAIIGAGVSVHVIVLDPRTNNKVDAIQIDLEHEKGDSISVFEPYTRENGICTYGEMFTTQKAKVWFK